MIPMRDQDFLIQAFQIRRSDAQVMQDQGPRYVWLSSAGDQHLPSGHVIERRQGTSSGAPLHHQRQPGTPLWITEGPLKCDLIYHTCGVSSVALPGVGNWRPLLSDPMASTQRTHLAIIAFDRDENPRAARYVARAKADLAAALREKGLQVKEAVWHHAHKGIDDAIRAGAQVRLRLLAPERALDR